MKIIIYGQRRSGCGVWIRIPEEELFSLYLYENNTQVIHFIRAVYHFSVQCIKTKPTTWFHTLYTSKIQISKQLCHPHRDKLERPPGTTLQYQYRTRSFQEATYSKTCVKRPFSKRPNIGFQNLLFLIADQTYCRMLQGEHSAILLTFIKLPFVIKIFVLSFFEWSFYTGFTV